MKETTKQTAVEWLIDKLSYSTTDGTIISHHKIITNLVEQAKAMEFEQRKKDFVNGYKARAKASKLIFDETSEMYAIKLFNVTFK
jgi:hypothetical protein